MVRAQGQAAPVVAGSVLLWLEYRGMTYTSINGMRSQRYPLAAADGCGCGSLGRTGLGLNVESALFGGTIVGVAGGSLLVGLAAGWWLGKSFGKRAVASNRRRRRR